MIYSKITKKFILSLFVLSFVLSVVFVKVSAYNTQELEDAILWMNDNGFTSVTTPEAFLSSKSIKREEAAKYFVDFATDIMGQEIDTSLTRCKRYSDLSSSNDLLEDYLVQACQLGILNGANNKINPKGILTNAHAIAIIIRMIDGQVDAGGTNRANNYYWKADKLGLSDGLFLSNQKGLINRGKLAILLYRAANEAGADTDTSSSSDTDIDLTFSTSNTYLELDGSSYKLKFSVKNEGDDVISYNSTKPVNVKCYDDSDKLFYQYSFGSTTAGTLKSNATMTKTISITKSRLEDELPVICYLDMDDKFDESDEYNNQITISTSSSTISISSGAKPDLIIDSITVRGSESSNLNKIWAARNSTSEVLDIVIKNNGEGDFDPTLLNNSTSNMFVYCSSTTDNEGGNGSTFLPTILTPGDMWHYTYSNSLFRDFLTEIGSKTISCQLKYNTTKDKNNESIESNFNNNTKSFTLKVK